MEPLSTDFDVIVDGKPRKISIDSDLFCTNTIRSLLSLKGARLSEEWSELQELKDGLGQEDYLQMAQNIASQRVALKREQSLESSLEMITDIDAMPILIQNGCKDVHSREEAQKIADSFPDVAQFVIQIALKTQEMMEAVGNSLPQGEEEETEKQPKQ